MDNNAIRFFSKFGHSKMMADVISKEVDATAHSVETPLDGPVDTLYLGAGVMLGKVDASVGRFIKTLKPEMVKRVVCFGSCAIIKSPVPQMRKMLEAQGLIVDDRSFTCRGSMDPIHAGHPNQQDLVDLRHFINTVK